MKNLFTSLIFVLFCTSTALSQLVITELSYNPPEMGSDTLEYVEILNNSNQAIDLTDYKFTRGITYTFPDTNIAANAYILIVKNTAAFSAIYGINALGWSNSDAMSGNSFNNTGELVEIVDAAGAVVFSFTYAKVAPWPTFTEGTDGGGASIELCNPEADANDGENWKVSTNDLGFMVNGRQIFGTPGTANSIPSCSVEPDVIVEVSSNIFTPRDITIDVGQTVRWVNNGGNHNINGTQTTYPNNPESFGNGAPSGAAWTYDFTFNTAGFYNYQCDPHASLGMEGTVTVNGPVVTDIYPVRTITSVTTTNSDGLTDSLNITCSLQGIVYGVNLNAATGLQFTVIDENNNGIGAFSGSGNLGYTVQEGDEVVIKGRIDNFRGLTQMRLDSVRVLSQNNNLVNPIIVTEFLEEDESSFVLLGYVNFLDPSQWTGTGSGFNVTMVNGTGQQFAIRIDNDIDAYSAPFPGDNTYFVTGLLGQFAPQQMAPYSGGYQLLPRYLVDFDPAGSTQNILDANMSLSPNPVNNIVTIKTDAQPESIILYNAQGQQLSVIHNSLEVDMSACAAGVYFVKAVKGDKSSTVRIIKM
jgi:plastocyanin/DNA/RNA endonuclease YhcR with UshA esterase domain